MRLLALAALSLLLPVSAASAAVSAAASAAVSAAAPTDAEAFERLKSMSGRWSANVEQMPAPVTISWKATANGTALVETMFEGTPHEMMSIYYMDGATLRMTHYCAAGNQPHMRYDGRRSSADEIVFGFDGGTSMNPRKDYHIHEGRIALADGSVSETWAGWNEGKQADVKKFTMTRASAE
jgi:hypothetical protein